MMKKHLIVLTSLTFCFIIGCNKETCTDGIQNGDETGIDCGGDCDPCPSCSDGIMNGNETGIDCGGDCIPCFDCESAFCSYLSGGTSPGPRSSKIWVCTYIDDVPIDSADSGWKISPIELTYNSSGQYIEKDVVHAVTVNGFWTFDDPADPKEVTYIYEDGSEDTEAIILLTNDEFIFKIGNEVTRWEPK